LLEAVRAVVQAHLLPTTVEEEELEGTFMMLPSRLKLEREPL
jgi:hypothetical protein